MNVFVKICGLRTPGAVAAAVAAGADALGFVFAESPRRVSPEEAASLCADLPDHIVRVAVMRHPTAAEWRAVQSVFQPHWLQTDSADFEVLQVDAPVSPMPVYRDTPDLDEDAVAACEQVVFEAGDSGVGQRADWERASRLAVRTRLLLAGGLTPENVGAAIRQVRPWGVDVSSGVERRRGEKDLNRIADFVAAVRETERLHAD